jgi:hypothetical protein
MKENAFYCWGLSTLKFISAGCGIFRCCAPIRLSAIEGDRQERLD